MDVKQWSEVVDLAAKLVSLVGIPIGVVLFFLSKRRERLDREYGTYNALDDKYIEYLMLCIEHPDLDLYYVPMRGGAAALDPRQEIQQLALFEILMSQMERAYLMYFGQPRGFRSLQWRGWSAYIDKWLERPVFAQLLAGIDMNQYDADFTLYLQGKLKDLEGA